MGDHTLEQLQRIREQIARLLSRGDLTRQTASVMRNTLESLDRDIGALKSQATE